MSTTNYFNNSLIYILVNMGQKLISFLMLPLYTAYLSPNNLGTFSMVQSYCAVFIVILTLGLDEASLYFYFKHKNDINKQKSILGNIIVFSLLVSFIGCFFIFFYKQFLFKSIINDLSTTYINLALLLILFSPIFNIYQKLLRIQNKVLEHAILIASYSIIQMMFIFYFIVFRGIDEMGMVLSFSLTAAIFGIYSIYKLIKGIRISLDFGIIKNIFSYSRHIFLNSLLGWGITNFLILSLGILSTSYEVGIYTAISFFGIIFLEVSKTFVNIYQPYVYKSIEDPKYSFSLLEVTKIISIVLLLAAIILILLLDKVFYFFISREYQIGIKLVPLIIGIGVLNFLIIMIDQIFGYFKEATKYLTFASTIGFISNITLIFIFRNSFNLTTGLLILNIVLIIILLAKSYWINKVFIKKLNLFSVWYLLILVFGPFYFISIN